METGSFTAAAVELGLSPQAAGKQVRELEDHFGTRQLNRSTRSQSLTEIGRFYYTQCKRAVAEIDAAEAILAAPSGALRGTLRIGAPVAFANTQLIPMLADFMREYVEFEPDLVVTDNLPDLIEEGFDLAFRIGPLPNSTLNVRTLAPYRFVACAAPDYLERRGTPATPEDLASHQCLCVFRHCRFLSSQVALQPRRQDTHHFHQRPAAHQPASSSRFSGHRLQRFPVQAQLSHQQLKTSGSHPPPPSAIAVRSRPFRRTSASSRRKSPR